MLTGFVKEASKEFAAVKEDIGSAIDGVGKFIDKHSEAISNVLSVVSVAATVVGIFVPAIGVAMIAVSRTADVLNTIVAIKSGDKGDIVMSAIGILPTSKLGKGLKIAEEGGEDALKAAKVASAAIEDGKQVEKNSSSLCKILKKVGNPGCFTAGTVVAVEKGYKKIEDVKVGDKDNNKSSIFL